MEEEVILVETKTGDYEEVEVLTVVPEGTPPFQYQWYLDGVVMAGNDTSTSSLVMTEERLSVEGTYTVVIRNAGGEIEVSERIER